MEAARARRRGLCPHFGIKKRLGAVFEDLGEDHETCGRKSENHHHFDY